MEPTWLQLESRLKILEGLKSDINVINSHEGGHMETVVCGGYSYQTNIIQNWKSGERLSPEFTFCFLILDLFTMRESTTY